MTRDAILIFDTEDSSIGALTFFSIWVKRISLFTSRASLGDGDAGFASNSAEFTSQNGS